MKNAALLCVMGMLVVAEGGTATGFFHLGNVNGRACLIDPDGRPFLSLGVNHI